MSEINPDDCTLATCPIDLAYINYQPNLAANILFLAIFGLFLIGQLAIGSWYRTWTYMVAMSAGLILEVIGYIGRVMMHSNPFEFNAFLLYVPVPVPVASTPALGVLVYLSKKNQKSANQIITFLDTSSV